MAPKEKKIIGTLLALGMLSFYLFLSISPVLAQYCNIGGRTSSGYTRNECEGRGGDWTANAGSILPNITDQSSIGDYIKSLYTYAIGIVGILATVVIMIGGLIWISSMGNAARVGEAKAWIGAALTGLLLAMTSYTLLYIINPNLVKFEKIGLPEIENTGDGDNSNNRGTEPPGSNHRDENGMSAQDYARAGVCPPWLTKYCAPCNHCTSFSMPSKNGNLADATLVDTIQGIFQADSSQNWQITEAWPPTIGHQSTCHKNGSCVDINFTTTPNTDQIINLYNRLNTAGRVVYESSNCSGLTTINCNPNPNATAPHFHFDLD